MKTKTPPSSMEQIKTANLHTVFSLILDNQPISRAQITQLCDLTIVDVYKRQVLYWITRFRMSKIFS